MDKKVNVAFFCIADSDLSFWKVWSKKPRPVEYQYPFFFFCIFAVAKKGWPALWVPMGESDPLWAFEVFHRRWAGATLYGISFV